MKILGIDTAIRCTGYGIVQTDDRGEIRVVDCGIIRNSKDAPHSECLRRLAGGIREIIGTHSPEQASIENAFVSKNIKTAMILSYARGAVMTVLAEAGIAAYPYSPRKAKLAVCGTGASTKEQVAEMLSCIFSLKIDEIPLDSTDALALAVCHAQIMTRPGSEYLLPKPL
jgi:crossover junction endodeoxyribonuclease RuvC